MENAQLGGPMPVPQTGGFGSKPLTEEQKKMMSQILLNQQGGSAAASGINAATGILGAYLMNRKPNSPQTAAISPALALLGNGGNSDMA